MTNPTIITRAPFIFECIYVTCMPPWPPPCSGCCSVSTCVNGLTAEITAHQETGCARWSQLEQALPENQTGPVISMSIGVVAALLLSVMRTSKPLLWGIGGIAVDQNPPLRARKINNASCWLVHRRRRDATYLHRYGSLNNPSAVNGTRSWSPRM